MYKKLIFNIILDLLLQNKLLINFLILNRLILLLYIFCKNIKYLELYINIIKRLLELNIKDIVQNTIYIIFD